MTYEYDDTGLIRKLLSSSRGTIIDVSPDSTSHTENPISMRMSEAITDADLIWLVGLPNRNESGSKMWADFEKDGLIEEVSDATRTFLENDGVSPETLRVSFSQTEQVGLALISLESENRRILFGLNKIAGIFVSSFQVIEGQGWIENELRQNDGLAEDLFLVIKKAKGVVGL